MKRYQLYYLLVVSCIFAAMNADAAQIYFDLDGFHPNPQYISIGETVEFINISGSNSWVNHLEPAGSAGCPIWYSGSILNGESYFHVFNCGPGEEYFQNSYWHQGTLIITGGMPTSTPPPTPTVDPMIPSTTPTGLGITLILMGLLLTPTLLMRK